MKKVLPKLLMTIILYNILVTKVNANEYQAYNSDSKNQQLKYITYNSPNATPTYRNNTVEWFYNSLAQNFSSFSEEDVIEVIKRSMRSWSDISGINFVYKGKTSNNINDFTDGKITIGYWSNTSFTENFGSGGARSELRWTDFNITEGNIILNAFDNSNSHSKPRNLTELQGLITHEVGHLLAIGHSDNEESIMFADPYHSYDYQVVLRNDDIKIASLLYPTKSNDILTTVKSNLDIVIQSATYHSAGGSTSNIWAILKFKGRNSNGKFSWELETYGDN